MLIRKHITKAAYAAIILSLFCIVTPKARSQTRILGSGTAGGVVIVVRTDPRFASSIPNVSELLAMDGVPDILNSAILVLNQSKQAVALFCIQWTVVTSDGKTSTRVDRTRDLAVLAGNPAGASVLPPGAARLVSPEASMDVNANMAARLATPNLQGAAAKSRSMTSAVAELEGVVFADGTFVGPDSDYTFENLSAQLKAGHDVSQFIVDAIKSGVSNDAVASHLNDLIVQGNQPDPAGDTKKLYYFYQAREAQSFLTQIRSAGLATVEVIAARQAGAPNFPLHRADPVQ